MFLLIERFREELGGSFTLTEAVKDFLKNYSWPGNIRELRNVVEYFIYTGHEDITMEDLPPTVLSHAQPKLRPVLASGKTESEFTKTSPDTAATPDLPDSFHLPKTSQSEVFLFILRELYEASQQGCSIGREKLLLKAQEIHLPTSQQEIRNILSQMAEKGLARVSRGRGGSRLTLEGRRFWEEHLSTQST